MTKEDTFLTAINAATLADWGAEAFLNNHLETRIGSAIIALSNVPDGEVDFNALKDYFRGVIEDAISAGAFLHASVIDERLLVRKMLEHLIDEEPSVEFQGDVAAVVVEPPEEEDKEPEEELVQETEGDLEAADLSDIQTAFDAVSGSGHEQCFRQAVDIVTFSNDTHTATSAVPKAFLGNLSGFKDGGNVEDLAKRAKEVVCDYEDNVDEDGYLLSQAVGEAIISRGLTDKFSESDVRRIMIKIEDVPASHPLGNEVVGLILSTKPAILMGKEELLNFLDVAHRAVDGEVSPSEKQSPVMTATHRTALVSHVDAILRSLFSKQNTSREPALADAVEFGRQNRNAYYAAVIRRSISPEGGRRNIVKFTKMTAILLKEALVLDISRNDRLITTSGCEDIDFSEEVEVLSELKPSDTKGTRKLLQDVVSKLDERGAFRMG